MAVCRWRDFFPPYGAYAVFFFCGLEFAFSCFAMIISQEYYNQGKLLIKLFEHAFRGAALQNNSSQNPIEPPLFVDYQHYLLIVWVISFTLIMYTMTVLLLQFFVKSYLEGDHSRFVAKLRIAVNVSSLLIIISLSTVNGIYLCFLVSTAISNRLLINRFIDWLRLSHSHVEFVQKRLHCTFDESGSHSEMKNCTDAIDSSVMSYRCSYWMFFAFVVIHCTMFILLVLLNATETRARQFTRRQDSSSTEFDDDEKSKSTKNGFLLPR